MEYIEKAEQMAIFFHNKYEELSSVFGYETRVETRNFDKNSANGKLMIAVCLQWILKQQQNTNNG